ncbi:MAG: 4-(cytidine 5'-diphospho)-2-C-methyl-D-erythritol kinase [Acidobacteriota bacterium]|nr:4-(cytidine 5'-diphospho)-2-C-methyl-D-erythritol kinase [Acidobacteriota bacterium]
MTRLAIPSFAKINWILKILGKRRDGFHQISTLYQTIDLKEEVVFETTRSRTIQLEIRGRPVARGKENLLYRTAELLRNSCGEQSGVKISLHKRIPVGAGLGGGAGNAAMALLALNQLWQCRLDQDALTGLAAQLGSDIPFFFMGGTVAAGGRGEQLVPLPDTGEIQTLILLYPNFELSSSDAYALGQWDDCDEKVVLTSDNLDTTIQRLLRALDPKEDSWPLLENDFEGALFTHYPILVKAQSALEKVGCKRVMLCGSGSTLLGFGSTKPVKEAVEQLSTQQIGEVFTCQTLSRNHYQQFLSNAGLKDV